MTRILLTLSILFFTASAQAAGPSLEANMKNLGGLFKAVGKTLNDSSQNSANGMNAEKMAKVFADVVKQVPDSVAKLPPEQRDRALAEFQRIISEEMGLARELSAAFAKGDNRAAADLYEKMSLNKKDGHNKFKRN